MKKIMIFLYAMLVLGGTILILKDLILVFIEIGFPFLFTIICIGSYGYVTTRMLKNI